MKPRKVGSRQRMTFTLKNGGNDVDTTGSTFQIVMALKKDGSRKISPTTMGIQTQTSSPPKTVVYYDPLTADMDTAGLYRIEVWETRSDGTLWPYPSDLYEELLLEPTL